MCLLGSQIAYTAACGSSLSVLVSTVVVASPFLTYPLKTCSIISTALKRLHASNKPIQIQRQEKQTSPSQEKCKGSRKKNVGWEKLLSLSLENIIFYIYFIDEKIEVQKIK